MTRIKGGKLHMKRRRGILKHTKGFRWGRKSKIKLAKVAKMRAGQFAFDSRRAKKRSARALWSIKINAGVRKQGNLTYSAFIGLLKKENIILDRKILALLAEKYPQAFAAVVQMAKK